MSKLTWKLEFYPIEADEMADKDDLSCLEHSLQKWKGVRKENLEKHEVNLNTNYANYGDINNSVKNYLFNSCALCEKYVNLTRTCENCPLYKVHSEPCDSRRSATIHEDFINPYPSIFGEMLIFNNPEPMIELIELAIENIKKQKT